MKYPFPQLFAALLVAPLASLHAEASGNPVLVDQSTFGTETRSLPPNDYGFGGNATASHIVPVGKIDFTTTSELKSDGKGLPTEYSLLCGGKLMIVPEAENFRMTFVVANLTSSNQLTTAVEFRSHGSNPWGMGRLYRLDLVEGTLTKVEGVKTTLLAKTKVPFLNGGKETWPPKPLDLSAIELTVQGGKFQVRVAPDGTNWQDAIECEDAAPILHGGIWLNSGLFGDVRVEALPGTTAKGPRLSATQAEIEEAIFTSMGGNLPILTRLDALDDLANLSTPVPPDVSLALAVALSNKEIGFRLAALRAARALQLHLDVPALLLDGLSSKHSILRDGAANALINLKLPPEQMLPKVVDALVKGDQFARFDVKKLTSSLGEPFQKAVVQEIQARYAKATDPRVKIGLVQALSRDSLTERRYLKEKPGVETLALLAQALNDSSPEVQLAAMQTLRWLESPVAWNKNAPNLFRDHPEETAQIVKSMQTILQSNAPTENRAEAVGCLTEMRQELDTILAALGDKDAAVRSTAAQGLCSFPRLELQEAIPTLQKLTADADCKKDAEGTLGYIQNDDAAQAANNPKPFSSPSELSPEALLAETTRRVERAAKLSLAMETDHVPFPNDFLAHYSAHLALDRNRQAANARLRQEMYSYSFNGCSTLDSTKTPFVYALHYSKSPYFPGGLTPETEEMFKESMFSILDFNCSFFKDFLEGPGWGTENQALQYLYGLWYMNLTLLNEDPAYASRKLRSGKTVAQYYTEWNAWMKKWLRSRALNGFWQELGSGYCFNYSVNGVLGIYAVATDPETRQLAKMFLDLAMIEAAQSEFKDVRGANGNRYKGNEISGASKLFFNRFADGQVIEGKGYHQFAASGYRLPAAAVLLRAFEQYPPKPIVIANRRVGEVRQVNADGSSQSKTDASKNADAENNDDSVTVGTREEYIDDSKAVSYLWKTRNYMLGSMLRDPKTVMGTLYSIPWNGIVFPDGAGLFPDCYMGYFSFQHENVFIFQRNEKDQQKTPTMIKISPGLESVEENGWVFVINGDAYVGIKALTGSLTWEEDGKGDTTYRRLVSEVMTSPVLIEAGDKDEFGSFDAFKAAVQANTLTFKDNKVEYSGPKQPKIEFFPESTGQVSKVDGKPWSPDPAYVYSGPFMQRKEGESIVTVTVGGKKAIYDFDKATVTEVISDQ